LWHPLRVYKDERCKVITEKKPDFSGEWVLDRTACTLSSGADGSRPLNGESSIVNHRFV